MQLKAISVNFKVRTWLSCFLVFLVKVTGRRREGMSAALLSAWVKSRLLMGQESQVLRSSPWKGSCQWLTNYRGGVGEQKFAMLFMQKKGPGVPLGRDSEG